MNLFDPFDLFLTGAAIEKLCELQYDDSQICLTDGEMSPSAGSGGGGNGSILSNMADKGSMVRAARCLLAAVTQVLLLADTIVVKQLLQAKDKVRTTSRRKSLETHKGFHRLSNRVRWPSLKKNASN